MQDYDYAQSIQRPWIRRAFRRCETLEARYLYDLERYNVSHDNRIIEFARIASGTSQFPLDVSLGASLGYLATIIHR